MSRLFAVLTVLATAAVPATSWADHKPGHAAPGGGGATTVSALDAKPNPIVFGSNSTLSGRLSGGTVSGVTVRLEVDDTRPYGDAYKPATTATGARITATSDQSGRFSFTVKPPVNSQYRAVAQTSPNVTSAPRLVLVRPQVGLILSDPTPVAGALVRFRGTVRPQHDGATASIQRRSATGSWVTVARTTLRDAGDVYSRYSRRIRIRRDGSYRVKIAGDADHVNGFSRVRRVDVG
jgi:hypothetical protein